MTLGARATADEEAWVEVDAADVAAASVLLFFVEARDLREGWSDGGWGVFCDVDACWALRLLNPNASDGSYSNGSLVDIVRVLTSFGADCSAASLSSEPYPASASMSSVCVCAVKRCWLVVGRNGFRES